VAADRGNTQCGEYEVDQDGAHIAADLHTLLDRAHVPGPYVLAGQSFGGLYVLSFAAQFPDQVAGLVLLDSTAPKPGPALPTNTDSYNFLGRVAALLPAAAHLGAGRLLAQSSYGTLPPRSRDEARANSSTARYLSSYIEESVEGSASVHQAASLTDLDGKPLIVLTADRNADDEWQSKQDHLATLSTNSLHRHVDATHASLLEDDADSAAASQAIRDVVASVRTSQPLAPR
jgi:pimeloyl-ACP methyl ester carboxylesterase